LGTQTARLTGIERSHYYPTASIDAARVEVHGVGGSVSYLVPDWGNFGKSRPAITPIGSKTARGYLCLVRFYDKQPAVALVGVNPVFMGGGPRLVLLAASASGAQSIPGDFRPSPVKIVHGTPLVVTGDMRFFSVGGSDADSGAPLRVFTVDHGRLDNVSTDYPSRIRSDADAAWHQFHHPRHGPYLGAIATWAADECTLGRQTTAFGTLDRLQVAGRFRRFIALRHHHFKHVSYAAHLERFLRRTGYAH
jgi:hypothetical protein